MSWAAPRGSRWYSAAMHRLPGLFVLALGCGVVWACSDSPSTNDGGGSFDAAVERHVTPIDDGGAAVTGPLHLADTGLYSDFASRTLSPGLIAFTPR